MKPAVLAVTLFCAAGAATAQTPSMTGATSAQSVQPFSNAVPVPGRDIDRLAMLLDLNEGQKAQVKAILDEQRAKMEEFVRETRASSEQTPSFEQMQTALAQSRKDAHEQLSAVLTDAQLKKFDAIQSPGPASGLMLQPRLSRPN